MIFVDSASCVHWLLNAFTLLPSVASSPRSPSRPLRRVVYTLRLLPPSPAREDMLTSSSSGGLAGAYKWHRFVCPATPVPSLPSSCCHPAVLIECPEAPCSSLPLGRAGSPLCLADWIPLYPSSVLASLLPSGGVVHVPVSLPIPSEVWAASAFLPIIVPSRLPCLGGRFEVVPVVVSVMLECAHLQ